MMHIEYVSLVHCILRYPAFFGLIIQEHDVKLILLSKLINGKYFNGNVELQH